MPVRRRLAVVPTAVTDPIGTFYWSTDGSGLESMLTLDPTFRNLREARAAWETVRRGAWAQAHRFTVPRAATFFDGVTATARPLVFDGWAADPFDLAAVLEALAADRAALEAFSVRRAARSIADYLDLVRADFETIEHTARALTGAREARTYPDHLSTARRYRDGGGS